MYADFLPKLGRLSVVVHLPTVSTHSTKASISDDASRLVLTHESVTSELVLPAKTMLRGESLPGGIPPGLSKLSWGLRPEPSDASTAANGGGLLGRGAGVEVIDVGVPWSAADLALGLDVICRKCAAVIVGADRLTAWKDLPSENWAEMMEFWHCHKPTTTANRNGDHHGHGHGKKDVKANEVTQGQRQGEKASEEELALRGYGANSAIVAQVGVGFVDLTKMLFHAEDCRCVVVSYVVAFIPYYRLPLALVADFIDRASRRYPGDSVPWLPIQLPEKKAVQLGSS